MKESIDRLIKLSLKSFQIERIKKLDEIVGSFSIAERVVFGFFIILLFISSISILVRLNRNLVIEVPASGGELREGLMGFPRFINPLLAISDADRDLTALVYSGLLNVGVNGQLENNLAESYEISGDGKTYTFVLKEGLRFHDGYPLTSADIAFTIARAQDESIKSPKRPNWIGVSVETPDERTVVFNLKQAYAPFLENTTIGILPQHIWGDLLSEQFTLSQFNIEPIGSGPYKIARIKRNASGIAEYYVLSPFKNYALGQSFINSLTLEFYSNEESLLSAYLNDEVESIYGIAPEKARELEQSGRRIEEIPLTRIFGLFFNQNLAPIFANSEVRRALELATNKYRIVNEVLYQYGSVINGPIPPGILKNGEGEASQRDVVKAKSILTDAGWKFDEEDVLWTKKTKKGTETLSFSISTGDAPELKRTAEILKESFEEIGVRVDIKVFETGALNQNVIRPRKYEALLFGEVIGRDLDLFAFWHSSQRNDPGLNIALYTNVTADSLLEASRSESGKDERNEIFSKFESEINKDKPAVFIYSPNFLYILPKKIKGFEIKTITIPGERFNNIHKWYIETDKVWGFLSN